MSDRILFTNATLFDGTGADPVPGASVVVHGALIVDIGTGRRPAGRFAEVIDCAGGTLMPGLIDAHVHLGAIDVNIPQQRRRYPDSLAALKIGRIVEATLRQGYTTVRDAGGIDSGFRDAVAEGVLAGPRIAISGRSLTQTGGHGDMRDRTENGIGCCGATIGMSSHVCDGKSEIRKAVREEIRLGADQIKVMASGGAMSPADALDSTQYSVVELRTAVEEAEAAGRYVMAHAYTAAAIRNCVAAGVRSVEHGNLLDDDSARLLADTGTYLVPTLSTYETLLEFGAEHGVPAANLAKLALAHEHGLDSVQIAHRQGVRIGSGSDLLGPLFVHKHRELALKAKVMGNRDALISATRVNAEMMGLGAEIGTVTVGRQADLIVVDGDPLADIAVFAAEHPLRAVMTAGRLVS